MANIESYRINCDRKSKYELLLGGARFRVNRDEFLFPLILCQQKVSSKTLKDTLFALVENLSFCRYIIVSETEMRIILACKYST